MKKIPPKFQNFGLILEFGEQTFLLQEGDPQSEVTTDKTVSEGNPLEESTSLANPEEAIIKDVEEASINNDTEIPEGASFKDATRNPEGAPIINDSGIPEGSPINDGTANPEGTSMMNNIGNPEGASIMNNTWNPGGVLIMNDRRNTEGAPNEDETQMEICEGEMIRKLLMEDGDLLHLLGSDGTINVEIVHEVGTSMIPGTSVIPATNNDTHKTSVDQERNGNDRINENHTNMAMGTDDEIDSDGTIDYDPRSPHTMDIEMRWTEMDTSEVLQINSNVETNVTQTNTATELDNDNTPERNDSNDSNKTLDDKNVETNINETNMEIRTEVEISPKTNSENNDNTIIEDLYDIFCPDCKKGFYHKKLLKTHIIKHHPELRPFSCNICPKSFTTNAFLKQHLPTHDKVSGMMLLNILGTVNFPQFL